MPQDWLNESHIGREKVSCPRCGGAGKLVIEGQDCHECKGTGMINKEITVKATIQ